MKTPVIHCNGTQADEAFNRYSALKKAAALCPALEADARFVAMQDEAYAKFCVCFEAS